MEGCTAGQVSRRCYADGRNKNVQFRGMNGCTLRDRFRADVTQMCFRRCYADGRNKNVQFRGMGKNVFNWIRPMAMRFMV